MPDIKDFKVVQINKNNLVICDLCGVDYTNSVEMGGLLFSSNAVCPRCEPNFRKLIAKNKEERFIRAESNVNETFRDFVYRIRVKK